MKRSFLFFIAIALAVSVIANVVFITVITQKSDKNTETEITKAESNKQPGKIGVASLEKTAISYGEVELDFLRRIAAKEGAVKTTEAIDKLITALKQRYQDRAARAETLRTDKRRLRAPDAQGNSDWRQKRKEWEKKIEQMRIKAEEAKEKTADNKE